MKIIEALKELPLLKKRLDKQIISIREYASFIEGDALPFETPEKQTTEVSALVQSNLDLARRYEILTNALATTNATVKVDIEGVSKTIREWITFRNVTKVYIDSTYNALNINTADQHLRMRPQQYDVSKGVKLGRAFKEEDKNAALEKARLIFDKIDATLEITNVNIDLIGL